MKLAIFDMDGTVVDTIHDIHRCLEITLTYYGFSTFDIELTKQYVGSGMRQLVINSVGAENFRDEMEAYFRTLYKDHMMDNTRIIPGFEEVLDFIQHSDITAVILSNKIRQITDDMINYFDITEYFADWFGGDSFGVKKPSPVPVRGIMEKFNASPFKTIMIGDSCTDIQAGASAGAKTCFCSYGYGTLRNIDADYTVDLPKELIGVLEEALK
jgi:phosphoglycolate phosphatase